MRLALLPRPLRAILLLTLLSTSTLTYAQSPAQSSGKAKSTSIETFKPCQTRSPNSGSFFDLNPIRVLPLEPEPSEIPDSTRSKSIYSAGRSKQPRWLSPRAAAPYRPSSPKPGRRKPGVRGKNQRGGSGRNISPLEEKDEKEKEPPKSWHARGHDYPANFTMNFCGPVVEEEPEAPDGERSIVGRAGLKWENVSAYYVMDDRTFSLGEVNTNLTWRGRKLTLNFTNGSPCPKAGTDIHNQSSPANWSLRRKSTLVSLLCERDPLASKVSIAFVGTNDECTYFFEARSGAFCPAVQIEKQQVGPSGVFAVIFVIAVLVYIVGGIVYQRAVMHQRGWRQLPNYTLWHGIFTFVQDVVVIVLSSCGRCVGFGGRSKPRGYNQIPSNGVGINGNANRVRSPDDTNRLLDELDDDWSPH